MIDWHIHQKNRRLSDPRWQSKAWALLNWHANYRLTVTVRLLVMILLVTA